MLALAQPIAMLPMGAWLGWGLGIFAVGWVIQFVGHYYEGRKPAFLDDIDRKSTRLNSSHLVISYAVFCLKKKKSIQPHQVRRYLTYTDRSQVLFLLSPYP